MEETEGSLGHYAQDEFAIIYIPAAVINVALKESLSTVKMEMSLSSLQQILNGVRSPPALGVQLEHGKDPHWLSGKDGEEEED